MARREDNNFKKAMNGLLGYTEKEPQEQPLQVEIVKEEQVRPEIVLPRQEAELPVSREEAVIPSDMVITGSISTKSNMKILGSIVGDVECDGSIWLIGSIQGNVSAGNLTIQRGGLTGDVNVRESVVLEQDAVLKGNLSAQSVSSNARSEGKICASRSVELRESAYVHGDIAAGSLAVSAGAKIKGMVDISE